MTRDELDKLLGTFEPITEERRQLIQSAANTDDSVIPLLCEAWGQGRRPLDLIRNQAAWLTAICWLYFLLNIYEPSSLIALRLLHQNLVSLSSVILLVFICGLSAGGLLDVINARARASKSEAIIAAIDAPARLGTLFTYCYWTNTGGDKILIQPAMQAVNRLIKERPGFAIDMSDKSQVDTGRLLLSRHVDLYWKRKLIFKLLRVIGRDELVDFLPEVRELCKIYNDTELRNAARRCQTHLEQAAERRRLEFTLLRPADALDKEAYLLKPATGGNSGDENLLISVESGD